MAFDFFRSQRRPAADVASRVPPGQYVTDKWPVLHYGSVPSISKEQWNLRIFGLVDEEPHTLTFSDLLALPQTSVAADVHCVTRWTRLGAQFEGVLFTDLLDQVHLKPEATHAMIHAENSFSTNLSLDDLSCPKVMLVHRADGKDLEPAHGGPVRLVVPHLYFWKSAKWVRGIEFMDRDRAGFWESYGYHMRGEPWAEERYSD